MSVLSIQLTFPTFTDIDGQPLEAGYIFIGTANLNPITNPINVFFDAALTQPAAQPIRTVSGYPSNAGTPARLYVNSDYSIQVQNKNGSVVYSSPTATERYGNIITLANLDFIQAGAGAVQISGQTKLRQYIHVQDYGAVGDGVTDDTTAIQNAINQANIIGGDVLFDELTYITSTLIPKSYVTLQLNGATLKLKNGTNERIFNGGVAGINFAILNGTLDGNKTNNQGNFNLSGATNFTNWNGVQFKNIIWQNIYRTSLILDGTTKNVLIENVAHNDCGLTNIFGLFGYGLECYPGTSLITIRNFTINNMFGFGIHFIGCVDFTAENLIFNNLNFGGVSIAITWTEAKRGVVRNIVCNNVTGDNLEVNASTDQIIENAIITSPGNRGVLLGDNATGIFNERVTLKNVKITSTGGSFSVAASFIKNCTFDKFQTDKDWATVISGAAGAGDRNNVIQDSFFPFNITTVYVFFQKFHLKRVRFNNFYVNDHDGVISTFTNPQVNNSFSISLLNGATTSISFENFNAMGADGMVCGRLRATSFFSNSQGTYHECLFVASSDNTTLNLSAITTVDNAIARTLTITANAANRRIDITNSTGVDLEVYWTVELHKADV